MSVWTLFLSSACILYLLARPKEPEWTKIRLIDSVMVLIGVMFAVQLLLGIRHENINWRIVISDGSYFINMGIVYLAVRLAFRNSKSGAILLAVIVGSLIVWSGKGLLFFLVGIGEQAGANVRAVTDSVRSLFPLLVVLGFSFVVLRGQLKRYWLTKLYCTRQRSVEALTL